MPADLTFTIEFDSNGEPVLKNIASGVDRLKQNATGADVALGKVNGAMATATVHARPLSSALVIVGGQLAGLGPVTNLAANAIITLATASGPTGIALAALAVTVGLLVYRISSARERLAELSQTELAGLAREKSFLDLEQRIRLEIRLAEAFGDRVKEIHVQMDALRVKAEKAGDSKLLSLVDRLEKAEIGKFRTDQSKDFTNSLKDQNNQLEQEFIKLTQGEGAARFHALALLEIKAASIAMTAEMRTQLGAYADAIKKIDEYTTKMKALRAAEQVGVQAMKTIADQARSMQELRGQMAIEKLPESQRGVAAIDQELKKRLEKIEEWKQVSIRAGQDVASANQQAAKDSAAARTAAAQSAFDQLLDLEKSLSLELMTESARRIEIVNREKEAHLKILDELVRRAPAREAEAAELRIKILENAADKIGEITREPFEKLFDEISGQAMGGLMDTLKGIAMGTQDVDAGMKNMLRNIALYAMEATIKLMILEPLLDKLKKSLSSSVTEGGGGGGGFNWMGLLSGLLGGLLGGGSATYTNAQGLQEYHAGGVVGEAYFPTRFVDPALFINARRYHEGGIAGDEVPIIARKGETIRTEEQERALQQQQHSPDQIVLKPKVVIQGGIIPRAGVSPEEVVQIVMEDVTNDGPVRRAILRERMR